MTGFNYPRFGAIINVLLIVLQSLVVPMLHGLQGTVIGMLLDPTPSFCMINAIITAMFDFCILRILQLNVAK